MATPNDKKMRKKDKNPATKQDIKDLKNLVEESKQYVQDFANRTGQNFEILKENAKKEMLQLRTEFKDSRTKIFDKMVTKDVFHMHIRIIYEKLDEIESKMLTKEEHQKSMNLLDAFATELQAAREERILWGQQHLRHDDSIVDHEKRISVLEGKSICS